MSRELLIKLREQGGLSRPEFRQLLAAHEPGLQAEAAALATALREQHYGNRVFIRGLLEISNYCRQDCFYCGIRCSNRKVQRYRLSPEQILECCEMGYPLGFRTFVLQSGEDPGYSDELISDLVREIKLRHPDCAVTLSLGEKNFSAYKAFREAGADRYLLRHETADAAHFGRLHPLKQSLQNRMRCLQDLRSLGYQVGSGFMVGSPFQSPQTLAEDLYFLSEFKPEMVGIGPFLPHRDTVFANAKPGDMNLTLFLLSILRLMLPKVLLPATTALGSIAPEGREKGVLAGANVIMPNLSPPEARDKYMIYNNKLRTGAEGAEGLRLLAEKMRAIGCEIAVDRGDYPDA
ncbi:MAG: [FeFe] hydrogenase H-cluster radical SAM maturase HydE [Oligosphaeraceae bacterium]|nr:[FeFe] hydrogenase H-cluster radical SAM maturase HydE [Oligosphaeraceae bacterium]